VSKKTLPRGAAPGALYVLAVAAGILLSKPLAIVLAVLATLVLLLVVAGLQAAQRHFPDLGRLPLVEDHGFHAHLRDLAGERHSPRAGSIRAGHAISAGQDITAASAIEAGRGIRAGGDIQSGAPPQSGWIDPDELGGYLERINRTMEKHGFGRNPNLASESVETEAETLLPARIADQVIRIADLPPMVHGRIFKRCEIVGPPPALLAGCRVERSKWLGVSESSFVVIANPSRPPPGTISFVECTFSECEFQSFTTVGTETQLAALKEAFSLA
jgi:hypothetical protein